MYIFLVPHFTSLVSVENYGGRSQMKKYIYYFKLVWSDFWFKRFVKKVQNDGLKPILRPRRTWWLMKIAKQTGGWDIWLGKKFGMDYEKTSLKAECHWHIDRSPWVVYRREY
jgi:hypothetical protein